MGCYRKNPHSPHRGNFCHLEGERRSTKLFLIIVNVLGDLKGVGGLNNFQFPLWGWYGYNTIQYTLFKVVSTLSVKASLQDVHYICFLE
jgi:hypothetical protein